MHKSTISYCSEQEKIKGQTIILLGGRLYTAVPHKSTFNNCSKDQSTNKHPPRGGLLCTTAHQPTEYSILSPPTGSGGRTCCVRQSTTKAFCLWSPPKQLLWSGQKATHLVKILKVCLWKMPFKPHTWIYRTPLLGRNSLWVKGVMTGLPKTTVLYSL